jgi:hypothetical protein
MRAIRSQKPGAALFYALHLVTEPTQKTEHSIVMGVVAFYTHSTVVRSMVGTVTGGGGEQEAGPCAQRPEGELGALRVGGRRQQLESIQVPEARYDGSQSSSPSPQQRGAAGRSGGLEEREAELEGLIAEYEEAVRGAPLSQAAH